MQPRSDAGGETGEADSDRLVARNNLSELARVSEWVRRFALEHRFAREFAYGLELSVNEALTNIMSYAYRDDAQHAIVVELRAQPDRIRVEVKDDGVPFNPLELPVEEPPVSLEKSRPTGRGIPLMRGFMDELHYVRRDSRNVLTMVMHCART
ncbi:MAG: ATP-binding protein [Betaproteobacteria bacterium]|nr:ATP-binding protein [Betaproteobacteria bacterium]